MQVYCLLSLLWISCLILLFQLKLLIWCVLEMRAHYQNALTMDLMEIQAAHMKMTSSFYVLVSNSVDPC